MSNKNTDYYFLEGGGEMGELIRAQDWSETPLGHPSVWPQSLCTMVAVMLNNPFGMYIAWGDNYTQIYNDGYRPILGATKHPEALGISTRETFNEIWHIIGSMFDGVMDGNAVGFPDLMLPLNRNGFVEECYFDFSYSPIKKENGEVGGVLVTVIETTAKKHTESKLKESEERFRTMAEASPILIAVGDETSNATYFNKAWVEITGRPVGDLLKFGWADLIHPDDREKFVNIYLNAFKERVAFTGEFRVLDKNGDYRWLLTQGPPLFRSNGSFAGYISSSVDITDQKEAIHNTEERKRLYETITQNTPDLIYVFDLNYRFTYANEALLKMLGLPWDDAIGKEMLAIGYEPEHAERHKREINQVISTKKPIRGEVSFLHAKLGERMYDYIFAPVINKNGEVEAITGTTRDVTEQFEAKRKIKESELRFQAAVEAVQGILWTNNGKGEMEGEQLGWSTLTGQTYEEYRGYGWLKMVHPDDVQGTFEAWKEAVENQHIFIFEHRVKTKDAGYRHFAIRAIPLVNHDGSLFEWVGVHTDIQEQKNKEERKDEFISIASHEMKTPLTTAKAYLQLLELSLKKMEGGSNLFAVKASQAVNRLNQLVCELLDVSKIRLGKLDYTITSFDFNKMIESTVENVQLTTQTHRIITTGEVKDLVVGDIERLQQVVINLLSNAIKYSPAATEVCVTVAQEEDAVKVAVKDSGIGMSEQSLKKIFEKYHRVEEHASHFQGLGIGLFISYEIIERHNGKLWVESEPGNGSTFHFTIPLTYKSLLADA